MCADGNDHGVRGRPPNVLRIYRGIQPHLGAALAKLASKDLDEVVPLTLVMVVLREEQHTAEAVGLLSKHHIVTATCCSDCRLHPANTAAYDKHATLGLGLGQLVGIEAKARLGIDGAVSHNGWAVDFHELLGRELVPERDIGLVLAEAGIAVEAAHATVHHILTTVEGLLDEHGVGEALAGVLDEVDLARGDGVLCLRYTVEAANNRDEALVQVPLDGCRALEVHAVDIEDVTERVATVAQLLDAI